MSDEHQTPLFYTHIEQFIQQLPSHPNNPSPNSIDPLLKNYWSHYQIDFTEQALASNQNIWKTHIAQYIIVQQCWQPVEASQGYIVICHGYFDHIGLYRQLIQWGLQQQYTVIGFDLPGHGLSTGLPAAINSFDEYTLILKHILENILESPSANKILNNTISKQTPPNIYVIGQSTGCAVIMNYLLQYHKESDAPFQKAILLAPLVRSLGWDKLRWLYILLKPVITSIKRQFKQSSHNQEFNHFLHHHDPLQARRIPLSWLGAMDTWYRTLSSLPQDEHSPYPLSIIQGTGDTTVDWQYNLPVISHSFPNSHVQLIPQAKHHLAGESPQYWQQVSNLLTNILKET